MMPIRASIMNRRIKAPSVKNEENIDKEFKDQLKDFYKKQELYEQKVEHVRVTVSPKRDDILRIQVETRKAMEDQLNLKNKNNALAKKDELNQFYYQEYCNKYSGPHSLDATTIQMKEKKEYLKSLMEENKQSECLKKENQRKEKEIEIEADHIRATTPCSWNRRHYL